MCTCFAYDMRYILDTFFQRCSDLFEWQNCHFLSSTLTQHIFDMYLVFVRPLLASSIVYATSALPRDVSSIECPKVTFSSMYVLIYSKHIFRDMISACMWVVLIPATILVRPTDACQIAMLWYLSSIFFVSFNLLTSHVTWLLLLTCSVSVA